MKCPECVDKNMRSKVYEGYTVVTAMAGQHFYDEDGFYHSHNPNWHSTVYSCSNGHEWSDRYQVKCGACPYGGNS